MRQALTRQGLLGCIEDLRDDCISWADQKTTEAKNALPARGEYEDCLGQAEAYCKVGARLNAILELAERKLK